MLNIGSNALGKTPVGQLREATHELVHAQQFAQLAEKKYGGDVLKAATEYFSHGKLSAAYHFDEAVAEQLSARRVFEYLGDMAEQEFDEVVTYIKEFRANNPKLP